MEGWKAEIESVTQLLKVGSLFPSCLGTTLVLFATVLTRKMSLMSCLFQCQIVDSINFLYMVNTSLVLILCILNYDFYHILSTNY